MNKTGKFPEGADLEHSGGPGAVEVTPTQPELTSLVAPGSGAETPTLPGKGKQTVKAGQKNVVSHAKGAGGESVSLPKIGDYEPMDGTVPPHSAESN